MTELPIYESPGSSDKSDIRILVVEDSRTQALFLQKILEDQGYMVWVTMNGEEALEYLKTNDPTLVLSDVVMPGINGYELCRRIKQDERLSSIPVVLLTYLSDPEDILKGLECGANNFIVKPYDEKSLVSRIRYVLVNDSLRRQSYAEMGIEIFFAGRKHFLAGERIQILDLLISSFEDAVLGRIELSKSNRDLADLNERLAREIEERKRAERDKEAVILELRQALAEVKKLGGLLPICSACKKIRDDRGYWQQIEAYIREHSEAEFTHSICPKCMKELYPELEEC